MTAAAAPPFRAGLGVVVLALIVGGWLGLRQNPRVADETIARTGAAPRSTSLAGVQLRDTANRTILLAPPGQPVVVMISSVTCSWCKRALRDLAELSGGRPLPWLRLLTFEGAAGGVDMLAAAGVHGAVSTGPASESTASIMSLQFPGTPIFLIIDSAGHVVRSIPGYPGRDGMMPLLRVMLGDADTGAAQGAKVSPK